MGLEAPGTLFARARAGSLLPGAGTLKPEAHSHEGGFHSNINASCRTKAGRGITNLHWLIHREERQQRDAALLAHKHFPAARRCEALEAQGSV